MQWLAREQPPEKRRGAQRPATTIWRLSGASPKPSKEVGIQTGGNWADCAGLNTHPPTPLLRPITAGSKGRWQRDAGETFSGKAHEVHRVICLLTFLARGGTPSLKHVVRAVRMPLFVISTPRRGLFAVQAQARDVGAAGTFELTRPAPIAVGLSGQGAGTEEEQKGRNKQAAKKWTHDPCSPSWGPERLAEIAPPTTYGPRLELQLTRRGGAKCKYVYINFPLGTSSPAPSRKPTRAFTARFSSSVMVDQRRTSVRVRPHPVQTSPVGSSWQTRMQGEGTGGAASATACSGTSMAIGIPGARMEASGSSPPGPTAGLRTRGRGRWQPTGLRMRLPGARLGPQCPSPSGDLHPSFPHTAARQSRIRTGFPVSTAHHKMSCAEP